MDQYKKLVSNTFIMTLGTFSSKLLVFLLMRFYTSLLTQEEYGVLDLIVQTCNLLIPIASVGINNAVVRFGLDRGYRRQSVFTAGLVINLAGFAILTLFGGLLEQVRFLDGYLFYLFAFICMSNLQGLCSQFVKAKEYVRLYAFDGIFRTVLTIALNLILMGGFRMGIRGYLLSTILTDGISAVLLFLIARLYRYVNLSALRASLSSYMLRYAVPLIPNTICTWIINISDRYLIAYLIGEAANGLYAIANKLPTILIIVANIFGDAWQISAVEGSSKKARARFFSNVADVYQSLAFVMASLLILTAKLCIRILTSAEFYDAWQYIPLLVIATAFACLSSFLSSVYMVEKRSGAVFFTTLASAAMNLGLNFVLIPQYGPNGAAFATMASYMMMFAVRMVHTRSFLKIRWKLGKMAVNILLIASQAVLLLAGVQGELFLEAGLFLLVLLVNSRTVLQAVRRIGI